MDTRASCHVVAARTAYRLAQQVLPRYSHPKCPHRYTLPQAAACVLLAFYLRPIYRDMERWLPATDKVCAALEVKRVPDYSTLARAYRRLLRWNVLDAMRCTLLDEAGVEEDVIACDSIGYVTT